MSWEALLVNLAVTAGLVAVLMLATFLYAMRTRVHAVRHTGKRLLEKHMARSRGRRTPSTFGAPAASSPGRRAEAR